MLELTDIQRKVFEFIRDKIVTGHMAPTAREVAAHFGYRSYRAAEDHIQALIRKGWLQSEKGKARSLRLTQSPASSAFSSLMHIPLFGSIPAGFGSDREQEADRKIAVTPELIGFKAGPNTFALEVTGDSMTGRHICDGDIVLLEHGVEPRNGQIVAALIDRLTTLKTFLIKDNKAYLRAENPKYPDLIPSEELVIQGVFRALIRRAAS